MTTKKAMLIVGVFIFVFGVLVACGQSANDGSGDTTNEKGTGQEEEAQDTAASGSLTASGSSALQPLVQEAADQFMADNPDAQLNVQAGGSGTGLSQVSEQQVDIGNSDVFAEEKEGIPAGSLVDHKVCVVGMAAAVNPDVGIEDITSEDLVKVFKGEITNWSDLGGNDQEITLVNRPDSSGTRATFEKYALGGETAAEGITEDSSGTVQKIISETPGAIGYLALSYFTGDRVVALKVDGVEPTEDNIATNDYKIWAYEHMYTYGEPEGLSKQFLDYMLSDDIQNNLVPELGYIPITKMKVERDAEGNVK